MIAAGSFAFDEVVSNRKLLLNADKTELIYFPPIASKVLVEIQAWKWKRVSYKYLGMIRHG